MGNSGGEAHQWGRGNDGKGRHGGHGSFFQEGKAWVGRREKWHRGARQLFPGRRGTCEEEGKFFSLDRVLVGIWGGVLAMAMVAIAKTH